MTHETPLLEVRDLYRDYQTADGPLSVLRGVSFSMPRGVVAAVTGVSGVGKSTLLHILGGLDSANRGEVRVAGESLTARNENDRARFRLQKIGFVFQHHYLLEEFTALENVMIPQLIAGADRAQATKVAEQLLSRVGLTERKNHRPMQLSGGEQQRVAVARALANSPELILADEPTGNLDTDTGRRLHELLLEIAQTQKTGMIIATHNRELAQRCNAEWQVVGGRLESVRGGWG